MSQDVNWEAIALAAGMPQEGVPAELVEIFDHLDEKIKDANGLSFQSRESYGLRSTQIIGLVVMLWRMGLLDLSKISQEPK